MQVICYEINLAEGSPVLQAGDDSEVATSDELERFHEHLEKTLIDIDFLDPDTPRLLMRRLRRLYNRARLEQTEVNILRGILTATQKFSRNKP